MQSDRWRSQMLKLSATTVALFALMVIPAGAQTANPGGTSTTAPSAPNSGAGIPGKPGSKSGPAVKPGSGTTGAATEDQHTRQQDSSKIPGMPGNKSGPSQKAPSG